MAFIGPYPRFDPVHAHLYMHGGGRLRNLSWPELEAYAISDLRTRFGLPIAEARARARSYYEAVHSPPDEGGLRLRWLRRLQQSRRSSQFDTGVAMNRFQERFPTVGFHSYHPAYRVRGRGWGAYYRRQTPALRSFYFSPGWRRPPLY